MNFRVGRLPERLFVSRLGVILQFKYGGRADAYDRNVDSLSQRQV